MSRDGVEVEAAISAARCLGAAVAPRAAQRQPQRVGEEAAARAAVAPTITLSSTLMRAEQRKVLERAADAEAGDAMARRVRASGTPSNSDVAASRTS